LGKTMTERHSTPDGSLTLLVVREEGDITIGFEGYPWHTHGDIIASLREEKDVERAVQCYLTDLTTDRLPIVVMKKNGVMAQPYVADFPDEPVSTKYFTPEETFELRFWSGPKKAPNQAPEPTAPSGRGSS
jgi:hypothetical protein